MIKNRLVLIDSFALIFRAFYGIPPTLTRDGHPINAAYGFASALLSAIKELEPEYLVACFDLPKPTKRHEHYVEYKAHRKPMPDDLVPQIQYCKKILEVLNIPLTAAEGYEGEDIIATIIEQNKASGVKSIIVTGDSDTFQLVTPQTMVYSMARGASKAVMYDEKAVIDRYGLTPTQFVDFKALKGDTSDNIPGVPGIGEKTASDLIQKYDSLLKLYQMIDQKCQCLSSPETVDPIVAKNLSKELKISEKVLRLLIDYKEQVYLSQKLSQIQSDAPVEFNLADARVHDFDAEKVKKLFLDLGFNSLIARMPQAEVKPGQQSLF